MTLSSGALYFVFSVVFFWALFQDFIKYLVGVKREFVHVKFVKQNELLRTSLLVVVVASIFSVILQVVDFFVRYGLNILFDL